MKLRPKSSLLAILALLLAIAATFVIQSMRRDPSSAAIAPVDLPRDQVSNTAGALAQPELYAESQGTPDTTATAADEPARASYEPKANATAPPRTGSAATGSAIDTAKSRRIIARDQFGQGVADVRLLFELREDTSLGPRSVETGRTDASGMTTASLSAGDWSVEVAAPKAFRRGGERVQPPKDVCVRSERIRIGNEEEIFVALDRGLRIAGVVVDVHGAPVPRAWVHAFDPSVRRWFAAAADAEGRFVVTPVAVGQYEVNAEGSATPGFYADSPPVRAVPGDEGLRLVMPVGFEIEVHVIAQESAMRGALGYVVNVVDGRRMGSRAIRVSDDGTLRVRGLDPGSYDVAVLTQSAWYGVRADIVVDGQEPTVRIDLPLQEGCTLALGRDSVTGEGAARLLELDSGARLFVDRDSGVVSVPAGRSTLAVIGADAVERRFAVECDSAGAAATARERTD